MFVLPIRRTARALALLVVLASCAKTESGDSAKVADAGAATTAAAPPACPGDNAGITLPAGFCASVYADSIAHGRHVAVGPNGDVYVTLEGTAPGMAKEKGGLPGASFVALRDTNRDGRADLIRRIGTLGNTGIGIANGFLYVDEGAQIVRYARADSALAPAGAREVILDRIPMTGGHRARNFALGPDGMLYVNLGSSSNSCQQKDRANESPGNDPCRELETRAGIWRYDANKAGQHFSAAGRFASGNRNAMGLAFGPDAKLYATQHGRDQLHDNWPKAFPTTTYQAENPAEELTQVNEGDEFGWPFCYYAVEPKKLVDAPEYGGDGTRSVRCDTKKAPLVAYPGHWAPMSLMFSSGSTFPAKYKGGAFIAFHGSWNRAPETQAGYNVVFQPMSNGAATGQYEIFADGFAGVTGPQLQPGTAKHRPTGLAESPDGALYVTDDMGGRIYRITYGGSIPK